MFSGCVTSGTIFVPEVTHPEKMKDIYYHIYNRGAHKANVFNDSLDYWRMLNLLYIANNTESFDFKSLKNKDIFQIKRKGTLVDIVSYCLMPNHFHIAIKLPEDPIPAINSEEKLPENITKFMRKLCTGYSNYYNKKYDHSGTIWQGSFKIKNVFYKDYLETLIFYIHTNPYKLKEPEITAEARVEHRKEAFEYSRTYEYSSLKDYLGEKRQQTPILTTCIPDVTHPECKNYAIIPNTVPEVTHPETQPPNYHVYR